ncbi:unnamed protein product [Heterobilharzia americana]|nr:unnamed protein product [Heterobilharzia americana]
MLYVNIYFMPWIFWSTVVYSLNTDSTFQLELSETPTNLSIPINSTIHLRCQLPVRPKPTDSVYVIWRFRHSHKDPAPNIWSFIHNDDDLARCPEPPNACEFVNQYIRLNEFSQSLFNNPTTVGITLPSDDHEFIQTRQLFTLKLVNLQPEMNGLFQCQVIVNLDAYDKRGYLNILVPPKYPLQIMRIDETAPKSTELLNYQQTTEKTLTLTSGKLYYFSCLITGVNPRPEVTWFIRHSSGQFRKIFTFTEMDESKQTWKAFSNYVDTQKSNDFTFMDDSGFLKCTATNSMGSASSDEVHLNIQYVPVIRPFQSNPMNVLETTSFTQFCQVQANPPAEIHWIDEDQNIVSTNSSLLVHHVSRNGPKQYNCVTSNKIGKSVQKLLIDVLYPPTVHVQPTITGNAGEALEVVCRVDANPSVSSIYWTFNKSSDQRRKSTKTSLYSSLSNRLDGSRLKIPYTYIYHTGEYHCHAETDIHTPSDLKLSQKSLTPKEIWSIWQQRSRLHASVNLTINYPPGQPTLTVMHSVNNSGEDYIILRCQQNISAPGLPRPTFHWIRSVGFDERQEIITNYSKFEYDENSNVFTIELYNLSLLDSGIYSCFLRNDLGSSQLASVNVLIKSKPILINKPIERITLQFQNSKLIKHKISNEHYEIQNLLNVNMVDNKNISCTFISSLSPEIHWLYYNNKNSISLNNMFSIEKNILNYWTKNRITKNKFGLWKIETTLNFQQVDIILYIKYTLNKILNKLDNIFPKKLEVYSLNYQVIKQLLEFIIILQIEGNYLCELSNSMGIEQGSTTLTIQKPPSSLIISNEMKSFSIDSKKIHNYHTKLYGPLFCQFYSKPLVHTVKWWRFTSSNYQEFNISNKWKLIYKTENFNNSIQIEETSTALIITGKPAIIHPSVSNFNAQEEQSIYGTLRHYLQNADHKFTIFTMLWLTELNDNDYGYYKCESESTLGSVSEIRQFQEPNVPQPISEIYHIHSTWTSATLSWKPGYHGTELDLPYQHIFNKSASHTYSAIQNLLSVWIEKAQNAQKYLIELEDHGVINVLPNEANSNLHEFFKPVNQSHVVPNPSSLYISKNVLSYSSENRRHIKRKTVKTRFLINVEGQVGINISGLMSNHVYTVTVSGINQYGQSKSSNPLTFRTKFLSPEIPGSIQLEESKELIRFSKGNPAICAQVAINNDDDSENAWDTIHFSLNYTPIIIINEKIFHPEAKEKYVELVNCKPLSWNHFTEIQVRIEQKVHYRARYCIYGHSTLCTEYIQPVKDISARTVIVAALLCILLVGLLGGIFVYIVCKHLDGSSSSQRQNQSCHRAQQYHDSQQVNEHQNIIIKDNFSNLFTQPNEYNI